MEHKSYLEVVFKKIKIQKEKKNQYAKSLGSEKYASSERVRCSYGYI